jgi:hypothetical protein
MKKLLATIAFSTVMAMSFAQTDQTQSTVVRTPDGSVMTLVKDTNMSWEDAAATMALARALNMDPAAILSTRGTVNAPFYTLAPAYVIQQQSGKPFSDIWQMYNSGMTWMQIANQLNVQPSYYNPLNGDTASWTNDDFSRGVWETILQKNYGMTPEDFTYFTTNNTPFNELVVGQVLAREDNAPVRDVMTYYGTNKDWPGVQQKFYTSSSTTSTTTTRPGGDTDTMSGMNNTGTNPQSTSQSTTTTSSSSSTMPVQNGTNGNNGQTNNGNSGDTNTNGNSNNGNSSDTMAAHHTNSVTPDPIKEWQVNGGNILAYNPQMASAGSSTSQSSYGMRRHHRHHRRHRSRRRG